MYAASSLNRHFLINLLWGLLLVCPLSVDALPLLPVIHLDFLPER